MSSVIPFKPLEKPKIDDLKVPREAQEDIISSVKGRLYVASGLLATTDRSHLEVSRDRSHVSDTSHQNGYSDPMNDITRAELQQTLSGLENRMDRRIDEMLKAESIRIDSYAREQQARDKLYAERFEAISRRLEDRDRVIDGKLDTMAVSIKGMTEKVDGFAQTLTAQVAEAKSSNRNTVLGILAIGVATVIGLWGANSTIVGSASSIFQAGQQQATSDDSLKQLIREAKAQSEETRLLLESMKSKQAPASTE